MIIIKISNQRSYYYIRIDDLKNIGFVWQELSKKGFFKFHEYYNLANEAGKLWHDSIKDSDIYFDSLNQFLAK